MEFLVQHTKKEMKCRAHYIEIESQDGIINEDHNIFFSKKFSAIFSLEWNTLLKWLQKNDEIAFRRMTSVLSKEDENQLVELNCKKPNKRDTEINPVYVAKVCTLLIKCVIVLKLNSLLFYR